MSRFHRGTPFLGALLLLFFCALISISAQDWVSFEGNTPKGERLNLLKLA
jgi:hypothetical protein